MVPVRSQKETVHDLCLHSILAGRFRSDLEAVPARLAGSQSGRGCTQLREEIGYDASRLEHITTYYMSKSSMHEVSHRFVGSHLTQIQAIPDETEFLEIETFPFDHVLQTVLKARSATDDYLGLIVRGMSAWIVILDGHLTERLRSGEPKL